MLTTRVPNKSGFLSDGYFSQLFFKMLNDRKLTTFLNNLLQGIASVSTLYLIILTVKTSFVVVNMR